ncbi:MAG: hypothetical protein ACJA1E_002146 [Paracoccaceae bacterium]|jgi:hypothetical protein
MMSNLYWLSEDQMARPLPYFSEEQWRAAHR